MLIQVQSFGQLIKNKAFLESLLSHPGSAKLGQQTFRFSEGSSTGLFTYHFVTDGVQFRYTTRLGNIQALDYIEAQLKKATRDRELDSRFTYWDSGKRAIALTLKQPIRIERLDNDNAAQAEGTIVDFVAIVPLYIAGYETFQFVEHVLPQIAPRLQQTVFQNRIYTRDSLQADDMPLSPPLIVQTEKPAHKFAIGRYLVTVAQYRVFCRKTKQAMPFPPRWGWRDSHPIVGVSLEDALAYCAWLSGETDQVYRLPTEFEWRTAGALPVIRAEGESISIDSVAWWGENAGQTTHPVGQKRPNRMGIYDMAGNVWEWTQTRVGDDQAVIKGGSWDSHFEQCSPAYRTTVLTHILQNDLGFRVVLEMHKKGNPGPKNTQ